METIILSSYEKLKNPIDSDLKGDYVSEVIIEIYENCIKFLSGVERIQLNSTIPNKQYISFVCKNKKSRAINKKLYILNDKKVIKDYKAAFLNNDYSKFTSSQLNNIIYTIAISFCASIDLLKDSDQKTPGTYFEYLIGHLFSRRIGFNPRKRVEVLNLDKKASLPTDYIFDLGENKPKYHLPIKTSTRERVIQVWAHQRVLDGIYGTGRFLGTLVCLSETKRSKASDQVVEICLPDQWQIYQLFIAQMKRIYYLDIPEKYNELNSLFPKINVKCFGEFFHEADNISY